MRLALPIVAALALSACGQATPMAEKPNDEVLTLGETPVTDLGLPARVVPCFALHYGFLTDPTPDVARDLAETCGSAAADLQVGPCADYARAAAKAATSVSKSAEREAADRAANAALKVCRDA